jgi:hypothetical protein
MIVVQEDFHVHLVLAIFQIILKDASHMHHLLLANNANTVILFLI